MSAALDDDDQIVIVAIEDRDIAGYARMEVQCRPETAFKKARTQLYIHERGVAPHARAKGVGSALLQRVRSEASMRGICRIGVDVWVRNSVARTFYAGHGFDPEQEIRWLTIG